ncbi:hypothetical protein FQN53_003862 [Emmonsiellopsis sp. PD_33]|nr:hypothetical protein FQN53_003862 [Emmonsiellopsis sp. PD_33]
MPSATSPESLPPPSRLFHYHPAHRVLICRPCKYAIQPHAISRHLKEIHLIYRASRRPYVDYAARLQLAEPGDVPLPEAHGFPVQELPVEWGFSCLAEGGCGYLCVSLKRMKQHWVHEHGRAGRGAGEGKAKGDWKSVPLQTFFRGNLLRYFTKPVPASGLQDGEWDGVEDAGTRAEIALTTSSFAAGLDNLSLSFSAAPDTSTATLLAHFISSTAHTLAVNAATAHAWTTIVPQIASTTPYVMQGLLACSALHLAHLSPHTSHKRAYTLRSYQLQEEAMPPFRAAVGNRQAHVSNFEAVLVFAHFLIVFSVAADRAGGDLFLVDNQQQQQNPNPNANTSEIPNDSDPRARESTLLPYWLYSMRGGCAIVNDVWTHLIRSPISPLTEQWDVQIETSPGSGTFIASPSDDPDAVAAATNNELSAPPPLEENVLLGKLLSYIPTPSINGGEEGEVETWTAREREIYTDAATRLSIAFIKLRALGGHVSAWDVLRIWPLRLPVGCLELLGGGHMGMLLLLGHYARILRRVEGVWFFGGEGARLERVVMGRLRGVWRGRLVELGDSCFY